LTLIMPEGLSIGWPRAVRSTQAYEGKNLNPSRDEATQCYDLAKSWFVFYNAQNESLIKTGVN
jgi:hypothetical protein